MRRVIFWRFVPSRDERQQAIVRANVEKIMAALRKRVP